MNKQYLFWVFVLLLFVLVSCRKSINNPDLTYIDNHAFGFEVPKGFYELPDTDGTARLVKKLNPAIIYLAQTTRDSLNFLFLVSKYTYSIANPIEYVFYSISEEVPTNYEKEGYKLIKFAVKKKNNKFLRVKVSYYGGMFYNIMFYFMKDDYSKDLYEIKSSCLASDLILTYDFMEKAALAVQFDN